MITEDENIRICSVCGKEMSEGYFNEDSEEYYCSDECLHKVMTEEEYRQCYEEGFMFWTQWY